MKRRRSNAGLFQRLLEAGSKSTSHKSELKSRRAAARSERAAIERNDRRKRAEADREQKAYERLEAAREREAEREEIRRERQKVRDANKLKRQLQAEDRREEQRRRKEEEREAPHKAMPSAAAIERAYKRGAGSLSEAMEMARGNPASGDRVTFKHRTRTVHGTVEGPDYESPPGFYWVKPDGGKPLVLHQSKLRTVKANPRGSKGKFQRCVEAVTKRGGARDPQAVCGAMEKRLRNPSFTKWRSAHFKKDSWSGLWEDQAGNLWTDERLREEFRRSRRNPADAAMAVSEEFHGRPVKAMIPVQQKRHYHKYLAELGELRKLVVETRDGKHRVTLSKFDGAVLTTNEAKNQLFITGGDQSVNLPDFGIRNPHEVETLGEVVKIEYFTDKEHLGSEGGEAVYVHKFRATNDNGRHKTVRMARNPNLIYYLRDEHLEFSGGSYEIRAEGIDK